MKHTEFKLAAEKRELNPGLNSERRREFVSEVLALIFRFFVIRLPHDRTGRNLAIHDRARVLADLADNGFIHVLKMF
jgi:hypothetical protein